MPARATPDESSAEISELRSRLAEAEETLRAIRAGEVDALVTDGKNGPQVFTLEGADHAYRVLIESMTEGALTLTADMVVLYANKCFSRMVKSPLEKVIGSSFRSFLSTGDLAALEPLLQRPGKSDPKIQVLLNAGDGTCLPVQVSIRPLPTTRSKATITMVVADMTQARHIQELLRNESRRAEAALGESEAKLKMAFASMTEAISIADASGRLTDFNDEFVRYHRFKNRDECSRTIADCPKHLEAYFADGTPAPPGHLAMERALRGETASNVEYRMCRKETGETWWGSYSFGPIQDKDGGFAGAVVSCREVTGRKELEKDKAEALRLLDTLLTHAPVGFAFFDLDLRFVRINERLAEINGYAVAAHLGRPMAEILPTLAPALREVAARILATGQPALDHEFTGETASAPGVARHWNASWYPVRDGGGEIIGFGAVVDEITERKRAEEVMRRSEAKLRDQLGWLALLEQITRAINNHLDFKQILKVVTDDLEDNLPLDFCCVCLFDEQARNFEVAQVGTKSTPIAIKLAMSEYTLISLDCVALTQAALGELSYLPDVGEMAFPFPRRLAKGGLGSLVLAPLPLEGNVIGFLLAARRAAHGFANGECEFLQQLSEHVALACRQAKLHSELQTAHDELRRTQQTTMQRERLRALGQMACGITHDISNAISPVTLYTASLLVHEPDLSVRARDYLQTIHQSVQNVAETIARMREFCRQGEAQVVLTPIRLNHIVRQALELTRVRWSDGPHQHGIVIRPEVRLAEDLPDIMGIESEVRDAIVNLILNAVDAMPAGGTLTMRTMTQPVPPGTGGTPDAGQACLELMDTGIGMDEDTRRRCLEPFFTTKGDHGSGMGLAMVYGMIARHRAGLEIESTPGRGTTVRMFFPVTDSPSTGVCQPLQAEPAPANQRILFIDDDPLLVKSMRDTLEADGHTVVTAAGGQEGIHAFIHAQQRNEAFTVVITDLGMPHLDGRKVASAVKAASPSTPVILLTGWGQRLEAEGDTPAHVDRLLSKPPRLRDLREALAACCPPGQLHPTEAS